jgi:hypothetical protein
MGSQVFVNASAIAPFREGYLLLEGMATGSDSRNGLQLLYGEVETADAIPTFQPINFLDGQSLTSIVTQNGVYQHSVPYLFALDASTLAAIYVGEENGQSAIWAHVFYDDGATLTRVATLQQLGVPDFNAAAPIFGASTIPGMAGFLLAYNNAAGLSYTWCTLPSCTPGQPLQLNVQPASGGGGGAAPADIWLLVVVNGSGGNTPLQGVLALNRGDHIDVTRLDIDISTGIPAITETVTTGVDGNFPMFGLFRGADGLPWYQTGIETTNMGVMTTIGLVANDGTLVPGPASDVPAWAVKYPAPIYYTFGDFSANPVVGVPETVPVYRTVLVGAEGEGNVTHVGLAQRTVFEQQPPPVPQGVVIGIFDSGPPIPNENLVGLASGVTLGTTSFGEIDSQTTGWTINSSVGGFFQYSSSEGIPGVLSVTQQFKVTFGVNAGFSQQSTSQQITSYSAPSQTKLYNGELMTNPQGLALVGIPSFIGYQYVFLDTTGAPVPGAPPYYELYTTGWEINALPFDYDPAATSGKVPGNLLSYAMDEASEQALEANLLFGSSIARCAWSTAGSVNQAYAVINQGSKSIGTNLSFEASIGGSLGPPGDDVSVTAGVTASFTFNYTWSNTTTDQIQTIDSLGALNDPPPPGAYSSYTYDVLILAHSQQYTTDLIAHLQSFPTARNTQLLASIAPNSSPWQIVHVLRFYELAGANAVVAAGGAI